MAALAALSRSHYDLVLMDGQMPEMDGFEAVRRLRAGEAGELNRCVPIVAMTALAMQGDRERCLEAGMDGYLSKPVQPQELAAAIAAQLARTPGQARDAGSTRIEMSDPVQNQRIREASISPHQMSPERVFDEQDMLDRVMGNREVALAVISQFLTDAPTRIQELQQCLIAGDLSQAAFKAHSLKGLAANVSATGLLELALKLEMLAEQAGTREDWLALAPLLNDEFDQLWEVLKDWPGDARESSEIEGDFPETGSFHIVSGDLSPN